MTRIQDLSTPRPGDGSWSRRRPKAGCRRSDWQPTDEVSRGPPSTPLLSLHLSLVSSLNPISGKKEDTVTEGVREGNLRKGLSNVHWFQWFRNDTNSWF